MIVLFTDYSARDPYIGQVKARLAHHAPNETVIDLLHEVPAWNGHAGAHLLAALAPTCPLGSVFFAVVDPGVGTDRQPVAVQADGRWFVGPDNGLLSVLAARATSVRAFRIHWQPPSAAPSFAGRDLFAPVCAWLASGRPVAEYLTAIDALEVQFDAGDLPCIIYIDHFGNAWSGIRAGHAEPEDTVRVGPHELRYAPLFAAVEKGKSFWYANSVGLLEIAANRASAAQNLGIAVGERVQLSPAPPTALI